MADKGTSAALDFTNVKEGGGSFNKKRQPEGDYKAKVTKVVDAPSKKDNIMQWLFTIEVGSGSYPYYCKHQENQLWKIRNLLVAAGIQVPKKKVKVDPNMVVGKTIAVTLEDDEYDGKMQSNIAAIFPASELSGDVDDEDEEEDAQAEEEDDDEDDTPPPPKKKKPAPVEEDDDEDEDEDEEPAPPKKKAKAKPVDDDLEELDIEDI